MTTQGDDMSEVEATKIEEPKQESKGTLITLSPRGMLSPKDHTELARVAGELLRSGALPKWYQNIAQIVTAWNYLASLNLPPQPNLKNLALINGAPCFFGEGPKSLAERTGELEVCRNFILDKDYKELCSKNQNLDAVPFAGICQIKRKGREEREFHFTVADARAAGLWAKSGPWTSYPKVMLLRRPQAFGLKMEFSDALAGIDIAEYDHNTIVDLKEVNPSTVTQENGSDVINRKFGEKINERSIEVTGNEINQDENKGDANL